MSNINGTEIDGKSNIKPLTNEENKPKPIDLSFMNVNSNPSTIVPAGVGPSDTVDSALAEREVLGEALGIADSNTILPGDNMATAKEKIEKTAKEENEAMSSRFEEKPKVKEVKLEEVIEVAVEEAKVEAQPFVANTGNVHPTNDIPVEELFGDKKSEKEEAKDELGLTDITDFSEIEKAENTPENDVSDFDDFAELLNEKEIDQKSDIQEVNLTDEEEELFFGKSEFISDKADKMDSVFDLIDSFKKMGEHIDVYLPMSNVAVRIYEFENDLFLPEALPVLSEDDLVATSLTGDITHNRVLINKIFENMVAISEDSEEITDFNFEQLSNQDMNVLLIAASKLLLAADPDVKDKTHIQTNTLYCEKCGTPQIVQIDLDKMMKAQYKKKHIEFARNNYNPRDKFETNFNRSLHIASRKKGAEYTKGNIRMMVVCSDPSYYDAVAKENTALRYLVSEYEKNPIVKDLIEKHEYQTSSTRTKLLELSREILTSPAKDNYQLSIQIDMQVLVMLQYIDIIAGKNIKTGKIVKSKIVDTPMDQVFRMIKSLPRPVKEKISSIIEDLQGETLNRDLKWKFECSNKNCNHHQEFNVDARGLVFLTLQTVSRSKEGEPTQN